MKSLFFWVVVSYVLVSILIYQKMENRYQAEKNANLYQQLQVMENEIKKRNENEILLSKRINEIEKEAKKAKSFNWYAPLDFNDPVLVRLRKN